MTIVDFYTKAVQLLAEAEIPDSEIEVSFLLGHLLQKNRAEIFLAGSDVLSPQNLKKLDHLLALRLQRLPLAYVIGEQEFWSLSFNVTPDVLIPRPETEQLLEIVLRTLKDHGNIVNWALDLGTGSGVIASVLALEIPDAKVVAVDRSMAALKVVQGNIQRHGLAGRILPICSNWGDALHAGQWDLVVSNPPYIAANVMADLSPEVKTEPRTALDGGIKGMEDICEIADQLEALLRPNGWFFMEIGFDQKKLVLDLFHATPGFTDIVVYHDYAGLPRVLQARRTGD